MTGITRIGRRHFIRLAGAGLGVAARIGPASAWQAAGAGPSPFPSGAIVRTVLRDVRPQDIASGALLFHEHVHTDTAWINKLRGGQALYGADMPWFMENLESQTAEMRAARRDGVSLIVDGAQAAMGRSVQFLQRVSEGSGLPIVVSGGYYLPISYPPELSTMSEDQIVDGLVRDAQAERWGALGEIGTGETISALERKVLRAIGRTQARTNLGIYTHTTNGSAAIEQLDILESSGATPQRVVIGHLGGVVMPPVDVHTALCRRGAFVGFDRVARTPESDAKQVAVIRELVDAGYADHVMLSSDFAAEADTRSKGGPGYGKTVTVFLPKLRQAGVSEAAIRRIVLDNPRRFLAFVPQA